MATSIIPPFAAFFMKVLSFALSEELLLPGASCAVATPATLSAAITKGRAQNCEIIVILLFMFFEIKNRKQPLTWMRANLDLVAACDHVRASIGLDRTWETVRPQIFFSYELSTRVATSL